MKIFIAAAHGNGDPGAVANNTTERDEVIKIVADCVDYLIKQNIQGVEIVHVPDEFGLDGEVNYINSNTTDVNKDICIEVNMNSNAGIPGSGVETFWGNKILARDLQNGILKNSTLRDRGVKDGTDLYFNTKTNPASALVELGFVNNLSDLKVVRESGAVALAKGVFAYLGDVAVPTPQLPSPQDDFKQKYNDLLAVVKKDITDAIRILGELIN